ncbi:THO complex subunit 2-like [Xenia sp. Carnegie-2017]|uniref:THO complex subunit 2-like n=1 Tax=Xenia sp. Carnegie-2017 TaxID=2897299 RepID=UPI001F036BC2|nr:THO complex subunit 2-like [Xenia sp. Carnegie-2017]
MAAVVQPLVNVKNWEKEKSSIIKLCQSLTTDASIESHGEDFHSAHSNYCQVLYELISYVARGLLELDEAKQVLTEIVGHDKEKQSILVDVISIMDVDVQFLGKEEHDQFTSLVSALVSTSVVSEELMKERIDVETLESLGLVQSMKRFNTKFIKIKTVLFYKQQKFNLLREESEGYSKLITELGQEMDTINMSSLLENIKSLIGRFNLDPNRVLDIMLDAFELHLEQEEFFTTFFKDFSSNYHKSTICHILGFKYQFYKDLPEVRTPHELLYVTALLIKHELLELDDIYVHLSPSDSEIFEENNQEIIDANQEAKKMNAAILVSDVPTEESKENEVKEPLIVQKRFNQKFGICHALLQLGAWNQAKQAMDKLPKYSVISEAPVVKALCELVHVLIEPLYRQYSTKAARGRPYSNMLYNGHAQCMLFTDLTNCVFPMLLQLGPFLSFDPILMAKVVRIGRFFLKENPNCSSIQDKDSKLLAVWNGLIDLVDQVLFPSLTLLECNPSIAEEVWILLKAFPYTIRYCLYGRWKNYSYNVHPKLIDVKAKTIKKAKYIAKRLSKENVKQSGRQIGKLSHSNPGVLFEYILSQIQKYDNFIGPVVDSLKYLTPMSYDVLAYCIIEALANPEKERLKLDDTNISEWLKSLAIFCGTVFKKYSIELTGLLQYVANQLKAGKSSDLLILREVVQKMSGIEISEEVTMDQLEALSGGEMLRAEGGWFGQIRNTKKSSQRLRDTLMNGDLAFPLCILMAQQRNSIIFFDEPSNRHLKLVGKLYDQCHDTMVQFGGFLATQLNKEDYVNNLPSLEDLVQNFSISQDAAFFLERPMFANKIQATFEEAENNEKSKNLSPKQIFKLYINAVNSVLEPITQSVINLHPLRVWNNISPQLYVAFWSLTMYDLHVPVERYEAEKNKISDLLVNVDENKELNSMSKKKKERERCLGAIEKLKEEQKEQDQHTQRIKEWLKHEQDNWIPSKSSKNESVTQLLQLCIFPRCVFTASDAIFCARFVHMLHNLKTPNFSTLLCFDRVFSDISYTVTTLTESEASRYGRFLSSMLEIVMRWHKDKKIYEKECGSYPGFVTVLRTTNTDKAEHLDYENFRHVCHKWQYKLTKALVVCLESKDYTQIRNTMMVLIKILPHYPKVSNLGMALERRVERICEEEKEKRKDLYALAIGYAGRLRSHKSEMIPEGMFHRKAPDAKTNASTANIASHNGVKATENKQEIEEKSTSSSQGKHENKLQREKKVKVIRSKTIKMMTIRPPLKLLPKIFRLKKIHHHRSRKHLPVMV